MEVLGLGTVLELLLLELVVLLVLVLELEADVIVEEDDAKHLDSVHVTVEISVEVVSVETWD